MGNIETLVNRMIYWCRDANLGYSQLDRWNFNPNAGNADCSSLVIHCLQEAGFDTGGAGYTGNLSQYLTALGWTRLPVDGNPQYGDILLNDANHVAVCIGNGMLAQASISENNSIVGAPGDQTGVETNIAPYYNYPWDCYLRWNGDEMPTAEDVWNVEINGVKARDRLIGIDNASNGILTRLFGGNNEWHWLTDRVYRMANLLFNRKDNAGTGMVDNDGNNIERTLYDRVVWLDKRVRELNPQGVGTPIAITDINARINDLEEKIDKLTELITKKGA